MAESLHRHGYTDTKSIITPLTAVCRTQTNCKSLLIACKTWRKNMEYFKQALMVINADFTDSGSVPHVFSYKQSQILSVAACPLKRSLASGRCLEEGNLDTASAEKQRIEDLQRTRRKWREENDVKHEPCFFKWGRSQMFVCVRAPLCRGCVNSFQRSFVSRRQTRARPRPCCLSSSTREPLLLLADVLKVKGGAWESIKQALRGTLLGFLLNTFKSFGFKIQRKSCSKREILSLPHSYGSELSK